MFEIKVDVDMHVEIKFKRNEIYGYTDKVYSDALDDLLYTNRPFHVFFFLCVTQKNNAGASKIKF